MSNARAKMIDRVKALLSKTMESGCTEAEAMAAAEKARAMMAEHDIAENDITFGGEKVVKGERENSIANIVPKYLAGAIAAYCGCKSWRSSGKSRETMVFFGLESDTVFATWLLDMLDKYINKAANRYIKAEGLTDHPDKRTLRQSFMRGCIRRINERLLESVKEAEKSAPVMQSGIKAGQSLIVVKNALVTEAFNELNLKLSNARKRSVSVNGNAWGAGHAAGNNVNFSRPVGGNGQRLAIGYK